MVQEFINFLKKRNPLQTWSEKGHISKAWGPFLHEMMIEQNVYNLITEVTVSKAKDVRAQTIRGLMSMGRVRFPTFASWWSQANHELLMFPGGKTDDFVDFIAHIGMGVQKMMTLATASKPQSENLNVVRPITLSWVKESHRKRMGDLTDKYGGR